MRCRFLVAGAVALMLAACSADSSGSSGSAIGDSTAGTLPPAAPVDETLVAYGQLLDEEGVLPVEAAEAVFAALVAPLPGISPATFPGPVPHDLAGASVRRLQAARVSLPADISAAVDAALEPQADETEVEVADGRHRDLPTGDGPVVEPSTDELADMVSTIVADLEGRSGHDVRLPIRARLVPDRATGGDAITSGIYSGDRVTGCRIALPHGLFGLDGASVTSTIAHEVWHCFQLDADPTAWDTAPQWIIEGQAEWAGEAFVGGSTSSAGNWSNWLLSYDISLFRRSYDAIGLYADAAQAGNDPWRVMLDMLGRENFGAVEALFGTSVEEALRTVAMADVRDASLGAEWDTTGPGVTAADGSVEFTLAEGEPVPASVASGRFSVLPLNLVVPSGDIARISISGGFAVVQMPGASLVDLADGASAMWCLRPDGCVCPDGTHPGGEELPVATEGIGAVAAGSLAVGELVVTGGLQSLDDACRRDIVGTWVTDTANVLAAMTSPFGGTAGVTCTGPYTLTFTADGVYQGGFQAVCGMGPITGTGEASYTGSYTADDSTVSVQGVTGGGSVTIGGTTVPMMSADMFASSGSLSYTLDGDVLTLNIPVGDSVVTVTLTRAS